MRDFFAHSPAPTKSQRPRVLLPFFDPLGHCGHTIGYPHVDTDLVLVDSEAESDCANWRGGSAFVEVKMLKSQGPSGDEAKSNLEPIIVRAVGYARLLMSARPFMLFSVGLLIFGSGFCVARFYRGGVAFSPQLDILKDTKDFIRVVHALTCGLTDTELSQDPTVYELDRATTQRLTGIDNSKLTPSFIVGPLGEDAHQRSWCTIGDPLWSSFSLLGRGTMVWKVRRYVKKIGLLSGPASILKTTWRTNARSSEASIYEKVMGTHHGLARYIAGGDVRDPRPDLRKTKANLPHNWKQLDVITVHHLRAEVFDAFAPNLVLHRLILKSVGRPLWEYSSDLELLKGMRAALEGACCIELSIFLVPDSNLMQGINFYMNRASFIVT